MKLSEFAGLAAEWDESNPARPEEVAAGSSRKATWRCMAAGHVWMACINNRTRLGHGCPECSPRIVSSTNNLLVDAPEVASEWHSGDNGDLRPTDVTEGSHRKVKWLCAAGHTWEARVYKRAIVGQGCPACSGHIATADRNLAAEYPDVAAEWHPTKNHPLRPTEILARSGQRVHWLCRASHAWVAPPINRTKAGSGCPFCAGQRATPTNNISSVHPELAAEWHPTRNGKLTPSDLCPQSNKLVWWSCGRHAWRASPANRVAGRGCRQCSGRRPTSERERAVRQALHKHFGFDAEEVAIPTSTRPTGWRVDAAHPAEMLVVEYDGAYWHSLPGALERDRRKTADLQHAGWTVIRIRNQLPAITRRDLILDTTPSVPRVAELAVRHVSAFSGISIHSEFEVHPGSIAHEVV